MIEGTLPFDLNKTINKIPVDNKIIPYLSSSRIYLIRNHYKFGKNLITISIIFAFLLILQLFSVNIYYIKFLPKFSLDQFVFLGIFSIIFYILGVRLKHKKILTCSAGAGVVQAQNYTVIMNYGQTPYQLGYLSQGNITGWTWWDTDGGMQQKNLILVSIMENATPVSGLSPPSWIQDNSENHSGSKSWKAGEGIHSWHYLDNHTTSGTPLEDIVLSGSQEKPGFFTKTYIWLNELITGVNPATVGPMINLTYWTKYDMADNYGFVKVSADRGENWDTLEEYSGNSSGWEKKTVNLTKYHGQQILIAFYFGVNNNNDEEWWIDDIKVTSDVALLSSVTVPKILCPYSQ